MNELYPLSKTEEGIYVSCLKQTDAYNLTNVINLGPNLDESLFIDAINNVFLAHPYLFTILIQGEDGTIYKKIVKKKIDIKVEKIDNINFKPYYFELLNNHLYYIHL